MRVAAENRCQLLKDPLHLVTVAVTLRDLGSGDEGLLA